MKMVTARYTGRGTLSACRKGSVAPEKFGPADAGALVDVPENMIEALERMGVVSRGEERATAAPSDELQRRLDEAHAEIARLRADNDALAERLDRAESAEDDRESAAEAPDFEQASEVGAAGSGEVQEEPPAHCLDIESMAKPEAIAAIRAIPGAYERFTEAHGPFRGAKVGDLRAHLERELAAQA